VNWAWRTALGREPSADELRSSIEFINTQQTKRFGRGGEEKQNAAKLAFADFCQAIFALNEFIYID
jgi:hypothetical protein